MGRAIFLIKYIVHLPLLMRFKRLPFNCTYIKVHLKFDIQMAEKPQCSDPKKQYVKFCLAQDCDREFLLSPQSDTSLHKHSKTEIHSIEEVLEKLKSQWDEKNSPMNQYIKKTRNFYDDLRKQVSKLIDKDQKRVESILNKVRYHHLPLEANSQAFLELINGEYDRLDRKSMSTLISEAENGEFNKDLEKQKQIFSFLDAELKKVSDKVLTLKYVLLSKKLEAEMLVPKLSEESKVANNDQFVKIYSLFNSREMLIRSATIIYRGSENDFSASSYYNRCIGVQNCLAIVRTKDNKVFGGFSPVPLVHEDQQELSKDEDHFGEDSSKKSFIFSINNLKSYSLKDRKRALRYQPGWPGPSFGVDLDFGEQLSSNLGHSYESAEGVQVDSLEAKVFLLEAESREIKEMEIWQLSF